MVRQVVRQGAAVEAAWTGDESGGGDFQSERMVVYGGLGSVGRWMARCAQRWDGWSSGLGAGVAVEACPEAGWVGARDRVGSHGELVPLSRLL